MIDSFEQRLADLLADRVADAAEIQQVGRRRDGSAPAAAGRVLCTVEVTTAQPAREMGDDRREVRRGPNGFGLRPVLRLSGDAIVALEAAGGVAPNDQPGQRPALLRAVDQVLLALHDEDVRGGGAFATDEDQGFELDAFRFEGTGENADSAPLPFTRFELRYTYGGRFWPVQPDVPGDAILTPATRMAILPLDLPEPLTVHAGAADLAISIGASLGVAGGAEARVVARLRGATPPGQLVGDPTGVPAGAVGYVGDADGRYRIVYRPPATLGAPVTVRVALSLANRERPTVALGELRLRVQP